MANFFKLLRDITPVDVFPDFPESQFIAIPARPSTSDLADDLLVDPEALKLETHDAGIFDENGDYIPQYSDDPVDLEMISPTPLTAPNGDAEPEPVTPASDNTDSPAEDSK